MELSPPWPIFFLFSNTAYFKLRTSIDGTLQMHLVVFICAYLYSITGTRNFLIFIYIFPMFNFQPSILRRFLNNLNLHVIMMHCSKYYIGSWEENLQHWVQNQTDKKYFLITFQFLSHQKKKWNSSSILFHMQKEFSTWVARKSMWVVCCQNKFCFQDLFSCCSYWIGLKF
jgi:hypothetical protein